MIKMKRRKAYKPRPVRVPAIVGVANVFAAPMRLLSDIRNSYVMEVGGTVVMQTLDGDQLFDAANTLELFAQILPEFGAPIDTSPITRLAARLRHDMPIDDAALAPVEMLFELGQRLANRISPEQSIEILQRKGNV
jgi:hypothetical protein